LEASSSRSEKIRKFLNVVLVKDGEIRWTDHVRNEEILLRVKEQRNILQEICKRKAKYVGQILSRNWLLQQVIEGKIKGEIEVARRRRRKSMKLLDYLKGRREYSHLKEGAIDRTIWRAGLERRSEAVVHAPRH
jgi:Zn-dependent peptidase ImmA (M78 family)